MSATADDEPAVDAAADVEAEEVEAEEVAVGTIRRTHDWLWRWCAVIDTGDRFTTWSTRTWTLAGAQAKARRAQDRIGMTVDWKVRLKK